MHGENGAKNIFIQTWLNTTFHEKVAPEVMHERHSFKVHITGLQNYEEVSTFSP